MEKRIFPGRRITLWAESTSVTESLYESLCRLVFYFKKFSTWIWRLPFAVYVKLEFSIVSFWSSWPRQECDPSSRPNFFFVITALFTNMRILKFESQRTIAFFAAVNHLNGPLRKQNFTLTGSKGHGLWFVIGGFRSVLCVSVFQGSLLVIVIMIDGSEKRNCEGGLWTLEFACLWKAP